MLKISKDNYTAAGFFAFFGLLVYSISPFSGYSYDTFCWMDWSNYIFEHGLKNIYSSKTDYLPLYHYILFIYGKLQGSVRNITDHVHQLKLVTLLFEAGSAFILYHLLKEKYNNTHKALLYSLFYFCNLAILYNCLLWGQVDGIYTFFIFASVISAYNKRFFPAILCFILAVNMKLQAVIYLPLVAALILPSIQVTGSRKVLLSVLSVMLIQIMIILPFVLSGQFENLMKVVTGSVGKYPFISLNAYNFWYLMVDGDLCTTEDTATFAGIAYMRWGQLMFILTGFAALFHLIKPNILFLLKNKPFEVALWKILITAALIPLLFFYFNTQMHERYSHPALIFIAAYALLYKRPLLLVIVSIAYFINLEDVHRFMNYKNYHTYIMSADFTATLYGVCITWLFIDLYEMKPFSFMKHKQVKNSMADNQI